MGSNPDNVRKNRMRAYSQTEKENIFLIFIHAANIYFSTQKNDARHLCVDIGGALRIP